MRTLVIISLLLMVPSLASARTWRVPSEHPSICGSVDSSAYGDTVLVAPGTYERERMVPTEDCWLSWIVMKDGVTLMSEAGAEETILVAATAQTEIAICCDSIAYAQIIGFTIRDESHGSGSCGIVVTASKVDIIRNVIENFFYGISVSGEPPVAEQPLILWNTIVASNHGISVYRISTMGCPRIQGNRIMWCFEAGIHIANSSPIVSANTLEYNPVAVLFYGASETGLRRNKINDNGTAVYIWSDGATQLPSVNPFGSMQDANDICRNIYCVYMEGGPGTILARYNYWGSLCPDSSDFSGNVDFSPWIADSAHTTHCSNCETCMVATEPATWSAIKALYK